MAGTNNPLFPATALDTETTFHPGRDYPLGWGLLSDDLSALDNVIPITGADDLFASAGLVTIRETNEICLYTNATPTGLTGVTRGWGDNGVDGSEAAAGGEVAQLLSFRHNEIIAKAIVALETKVGIDDSTDEDSLDWKISHSVGVHNILSASHSDTTAATLVGGDVLAVDGSTPAKLVRVAKNTDAARYKFLAGPPTGSANPLPVWMSPDDNDTILVKRLMQALVDPGQTTITNVGFYNGWQISYVPGSAPTNQDGADGPAIRATSGGVTGMCVEFSSKSAIVQPRWSPDLVVEIGTRDITDIRIWAGLTENGGSIPSYGADNPAFSEAAFRFSTDGGDSNWQCVTRDGAGGSQRITDSTIPVVQNTFYNLRIVQNGASSVAFYIDGILRATHYSNLPVASTAHYVSIEAETRTMSACALDFYRAALRHI